MPTTSITRPVVIPPLRLAGDLRLPAEPRGTVIFAHGSGSSRFSPRNQQVAQALTDAGWATLLFDLLTVEEAGDRRKVFDIDLLGRRLVHAIDWVHVQPELGRLPIGLFGASTGAAAALVAAGLRPRRVGAIVSRGGRPDLAGSTLSEVTAPTLLIVGGRDEPVLTWNRQAQQRLGGKSELEVIPGATHLFEERGALEEVIQFATAWFDIQLRPRGDRPAASD